MKRIALTLVLAALLVQVAVANENTIEVKYQQTKAVVTVPAALKSKVKQQVRGAHVTLLADKSVKQELTFRLSGQSNNGSFYMDAHVPATVIFGGLQLTCPDSAAVNIQDGKLIHMRLTDGSNNTLVDGDKGKRAAKATGTDGHKAALFVHGHAEWSGNGSLTIVGNVAHGYASDEYTIVKSGTISVKKAVKQALRVRQYFRLQGGRVVGVGSRAGLGVDPTKKVTDELNGQVIIENGKLTLTCTGGARYDKVKKKVDKTEALSCDLFTMKGGQLTLLNRGDGGRGLKADLGVRVSGGRLNVETQGAKYEYSELLDAKPHGIKSDKEIILSGGEITVKVAAKKATTLKTDGKISTKGAVVKTTGGKPWK